MERFDPPVLTDTNEQVWCVATLSTLQMACTILYLVTYLTPHKTTKCFMRQGIIRVRNGGYAFILPTTIGQYMAHRAPCDLMTVTCYDVILD